MITRRAVIFGVVCMGLGVACAQEVTTSPSAVSATPTAQIPVLGRDLARQPWYASADLPPESPPEKILELARETTPTVTLRSPLPAGSGILFTFIDLPDPLPSNCAGRLVLGHVEGEDETFLNGQAIGHTEGYGINNYGLPRHYSAPHQVLRPGRNVLAIRLRGHGGRQTFGLRPGPLTFALAHTISPTPALPPLAERSPTISPETARQAVMSVDPEVTAGITLHRKPLGFGRFGELQHDGLPAVAEVSPTRIAQRNGVIVDAALDRVNSTSLAVEDSEPGIDGWHKRTRVEASSSGNPVRYSLLSSLLYPGAIISLEEGSVLRFRARFPSGTAVVHPLTEENMSSLLPDKTKSPLPIGYVFLEATHDSSPLVMFATGMSANVTQADSHVDITLAKSGLGDEPGRIFFFFPKGIQKYDLTSAPGDATALAALLNPEKDAVAELKAWASMGLNEPAGVDELFRVLPDRKKVRIYQVTRYAPAADVPPLPVRPPQVDFTIAQLKYPVDSPATTSTGLLTFSGELHTQLEDTATSASPSNTHVTWYDLPVPPMHERGLLTVPVQRELREQLNRWALTDLGSTASLNGVDAIYKSRTQAFQGFSYLTTEKKRQLLLDSAQVVPAAFADTLWHPKTEPFSGLLFWWTYFIEGPYSDQFDQEWGNGLSLYGLYHYVKYTGSWDFAAENWDAIERMFSWFRVTDDWEWMRASNGTHGHGTGAGDCTSVAYAATVAYARLAEGCGRANEHDYGTYLAARAALFALNRFAYNDFATQHKLKDENSLVVGFHEGSGFLAGELSGYPWNVTSNISGNGVQPGNFDLYLQYAAEPLRAFERAVEKAFPSWVSGTYKYPANTLYRNNSGYITLPHIYLRARLQETFASLRDLLEQAQSNEHLWWLAPPVIGEVLQLKTGGVYVRDWGKAAFLGGEVNRDEASDGKRTEVTLRVELKTAPDSVEIALPKKPYQFTVNDGPVPLTDSRFENNVLQIRLRRPGENLIKVVF